jgi:hypothetical protein
MEELSFRDQSDEHRDTLAKLTNRKLELTASLERPGISDADKQSALAQIKDIDEWIETTEGHLKTEQRDEKPNPRTLH